MRMSTMPLFQQSGRGQRTASHAAGRRPRSEVQWILCLVLLVMVVVHLRRASHTESSDPNPASRNGRITRATQRRPHIPRRVRATPYHYDLPLEADGFKANRQLIQELLHCGVLERGVTGGAGVGSWSGEWKTNKRRKMAETTQVLNASQHLLSNEDIVNGRLVVAKEHFMLSRDGVPKQCARSRGHALPAPLLLDPSLRLPQELLSAARTNNQDRDSTNFQQSSPKIHVDACVYVRGREALTLEWVQYHRLLGVEHYYVYLEDLSDVKSSHIFRELFDPLVSSGVVTLLDADEIVRAERKNAKEQPVPQLRRMMEIPPSAGPILWAYRHCINTQSAKSAAQRPRIEQWSMLLDSDEFVLLAPPAAVLADRRKTFNGTTIAQMIRASQQQATSQLESRKKGSTNNNTGSLQQARYCFPRESTEQHRRSAVGAVALPWVTVGDAWSSTRSAPNGTASVCSKYCQTRRNERRTIQTQFERTQFGIGAAHGQATHFKTIVKVGAVRYMRTPHYPFLKPGQRVVFPNGEAVAPTIDSNHQDEENKAPTTSCVDAEDVSQIAPFVTGDGMWLHNVTSLLENRQWPSQSTGGSMTTSQVAPKFAHILHYHCRGFGAWLQKKLDGYSDLPASVNTIDVSDLYEKWVNDTASGCAAVGTPQSTGGGVAGSYEAYLEDKRWFIENTKEDEKSMSLVEALRASLGL